MFLEETTLKWRFAVMFYMSVLVTLSSSVYFTHAESLPCHERLTSVVRGVEKHGRLIAKNTFFDRPNYVRLNNTHFRVCICTKIPCLRKCCSPGKIYIGGNNCQPNGYDIHPEIYDDNLKLIPNYDIRNFHRVYGDTCSDSEKFILNPEDQYYIFYNGTLHIANDSLEYDTSQFCLENLKQTSPEYEPISLVIVMCFPKPSETEITYPIGMIISIPFLLITFIVYSLPELRNLHGKNLMSEVGSLLTSYLLLITNQLGFKVINDTFCVLSGFMMQYAFLATFCWLNVMCFDIWSTFCGIRKLSGHIRDKEQKKYIFYSCYAWGVPLIITAVTAAINFAQNLPDYIIRPDIGLNKCFFGSAMAQLAYFYCPISIIIICDITFFILTACKIYKVRKETKILSQNESRRTDETSKQRYYLYLKLFLVMGISWATEIISWSIPEPKELWYLSDVMNCLQGIFIFWIFVWTRKVKKVLISRFCPRLASTDLDNNTSSFKLTASMNSSNTVMNNGCPGKNKGKAPTVVNTRV